MMAPTDLATVRAAAERYTKHAEVILSMQHPKESPYTYIEVSTGAAGMVNEAWDKDAHLLARAYLASIPPDGEVPRAVTVNKHPPQCHHAIHCSRHHAESEGGEMSRCIDEGGIVHGIKCPRCGTTNSVLRRTLEDDYYNEYDKYSCHLCLWFDYRLPPAPATQTKSKEE